MAQPMRVWDGKKRAVRQDKKQVWYVNWELKLNANWGWEDADSTKLEVYDSSWKWAEEPLMVYDNSWKTIVEPTPPVHVTGVELNESSATLEPEGTLQLTATITPENATDKRVTWSSSDTTIATVSNEGLVTALAEWDATITVTTRDGGFTDTCAIAVSDAEVTDVQLTSFMPDDINTTYAGRSIWSWIMVTPYDAQDVTVTVTSSDSEVLTVGEIIYDEYPTEWSIWYVQITAVGTGNATITITSHDDPTISRTYSFTVEQDVPVVSISNLSNNEWVAILNNPLDIATFEYSPTNAVLPSWDISVRAKEWQPDIGRWWIEPTDTPWIAKLRFNGSNAQVWDTSRYEIYLPADDQVTPLEIKMEIRDSITLTFTAELDDGQWWTTPWGGYVEPQQMIVPKGSYIISPWSYEDFLDIRYSLWSYDDQYLGIATAIPNPPTQQTEFHFEDWSLGWVSYEAPLEQDTTITAIFAERTRQFNVTFQSVIYGDICGEVWQWGGTVSENTVEVEYGQQLYPDSLSQITIWSITVTATPSTGYDNYWFNSGDYSRWDPIESDVTIYAQFEPMLWEVDFSAYDFAREFGWEGSFSEVSLSVPYGSAITTNWTTITFTLWELEISSTYTPAQEEIFNERCITDQWIPEQLPQIFTAYSDNMYIYANISTPITVTFSSYAANSDVSFSQNSISAFPSEEVTVNSDTSISIWNTTVTATLNSNITYILDSLNNFVSWYIFVTDSHDPWEDDDGNMIRTWTTVNDIYSWNINLRWTEYISSLEGLWSNPITLWVDSTNNRPQITIWSSTAELHFVSDLYVDPTNLTHSSWISVSFDDENELFSISATQSGTIEFDITWDSCYLEDPYQHVVLTVIYDSSL